MLVKQRVKFQKINEEGKISKYTLEVCGRNEEELRGRVEKIINKQLHSGAELR